MPGWNEFIHLLEALLLTIDHAVGNAGLAIIIFTLIIKIVTLPLTLRSIRSTKEMQRLQPVIKEVNKRYKDDKAAAQAEVMRLYQAHGVNPMGGCLPMLVQLPIFFALYSALINLINGQVAAPVLWVQDTHFSGSFLWVPNLASHDPFYIWPVLSGIFQFITQRMSMAYGASKNADPQTAMMNRIMQFTPVYLTVIYLQFAAGPVIYWTFSGIFTAVQTYLVNGFGSLPEVPGFHWLPKRIQPVTPEIQQAIDEINAEADAAQGKRRRGTASPAARTATANRPPAKGLMGRMMEQAIAAQEAQQQARGENGKAAPTATKSVASTTTTIVPTSTSNGGRRGYLAKMMDQAAAMEEAQQATRAARANGAGEDEPEEAETSDGWGTPNGRATAETVDNEPTTASTLPRKRRSKR